eukprot:TRINITY_DN720_c0_g1_i1.p1 TRINITY_DN720_c0_g1~~TRINITY_DN720_c0_g1_i1.p1  ORF type:complete len:87 (+),score=16.66 TRINITY_DN720_c0_g1_i1:86-346(+)
MKIKIKSKTIVGEWVYNVLSDTCSICQAELQAPCPHCKIPGEDCPIITGKCTHSFHKHCMNEWISSGQRDCPLCRSKWEAEVFVTD